MTMKTSTIIYLLAQASNIVTLLLIVHWFGLALRETGPSFGWALPVLRHYVIPGWALLIPIGFSLACLGIHDRAKHNEKQLDADSRSSEIGQ